MKVWNFPLNNNGTNTGFNDGAIDTFAGNRLSSVVREVIQNSLDAKKSHDEPVQVCFQLKTVPSKKFSGFANIKPHLEKSRDMAEEQKLRCLMALAPPPTRDDARCPDVGVEKAIP